MNVSKETNRRRTLCAVSLIVLGIIFITDPLTHILLRGRSATPPAIALRGFAAPVHLALFVASVAGITQLLRRRADLAGLIGGSLVVMGWAVGIRILALGQVESLLESGITGLPADTLRKMFEAAPIVWASIVPVGLLFPIGLIILGVTIAVANPIPRAIGVLLAVGGALFPVGRIGRLSWAVVSCDLILGAAFALIGWQILTRVELWTGEGTSRTSRPEPTLVTAS